MVKAKCLKSDEVVAVKLIMIHSKKDDVAGMNYRMKQLVSEVHILRKLSAIKGNVFTNKLLDVILPEKLDINSSKPIPYLFLVMEYIPFDLLGIQESNKLANKFSEQHIIVMLYNMLCSLNFFHSAGLLHRDIKPSNILVDKNCITKLCNFGHARPCLDSTSKIEDAPESPEERQSIVKALLSDRELREQQPRALSPHVTARRYRPPEVIVSEKVYDQAVDIWGLGCILGELLLYLKTKESDKSQIFRGKHCYPLSPRNE